jgi:hypothetical protein
MLYENEKKKYESVNRALFAFIHGHQKNSCGCVLKEIFLAGSIWSNSVYSNVRAEPAKDRQSNKNHVLSLSHITGVKIRAISNNFTTWKLIFWSWKLLSLEKSAG